MTATFLGSVPGLLWQNGWCEADEGCGVSCDKVGGRLYDAVEELAFLIRCLSVASIVVLTLEGLFK